MFPLIFALAVIQCCILVHELGHFWAARWAGVRITSFSLGFGPALCRWSFGGVEYRLSWFLLGGYVRLEEFEPGRQPTYPFYKSLAVLLGGPGANLVLAMLAAIFLQSFGLPKPAWLTQPVVVVQTEMGLQAGDRILSIDGKQVTSWYDALIFTLLGTGWHNNRPASELVVLQHGRKVSLWVPVKQTEAGRQLSFLPATPARLRRSYAELGLREGDLITAWDGHPLQLGVLSTLSGDGIFTILRNGRQLLLDIKDLPPLAVQYPTVIVHNSAVKLLTETLNLTADFILAVINPQSPIGLRHLSGPVGLITISASALQLDGRLLIWIILVLNVNLAVINLVPIPIMDGGQVLLAAWARLTRVALSVVFMHRLQLTCYLFLIAVMAYVCFLDLSRLLP